MARSKSLFETILIERTGDLVRNPHFGVDSPGTALIGHAFRYAIASGCTSFHFLQGQEPCKNAWGAEDRCDVVRRLRHASDTVQPAATRRDTPPRGTSEERSDV